MERLFVLAVLVSVVTATTFTWTNDGIVYGKEQYGAKVFLGIPFAAPAERFKPPRHPSFHWQPFSATKFGNECPQQIVGDEYSLNEDCLNLNIYTPKHAYPGAKLPVLVYWYGGAFLFNSNQIPQEQGETLAKSGNIIVVTPNHRLGALGYLYIDELTQAQGYKNNKVNFALLDCIRALEWVRDNIGYFGGDASKVTIGGLSSGAFMVSWLTTIPQSWELYNNVLQLEGPLTALDQAVVYTKPVANNFGQQFVTAVGCSGGDADTVMSCLANKDMKTLAVVWQNFPLVPVFDMDLFPLHPDVAISSPEPGHVKPAPTFMFAVSNPGTSFVGPFVQPTLQVGWEGFITYLFPEVGALIAGQYPDSIYGPLDEASAFARGSELISDSVWLCPLRRHAKFQSLLTPNVWVATWNVTASFIKLPPQYGCVHGTELPFIFGNAVDISTQIPGSFTPEEAKLSKKIMDAVIHFIQHGNPGPEYKPWIADSEVNTIIDLTDIITSPVLRQIRTPPSGYPFPTRCDLFDIIFEQEISGAIDVGKLLESVGKKANIWPGSKKF